MKVARIGIVLTAGESYSTIQLRGLLRPGDHDEEQFLLLHPQEHQISTVLGEKEEEMKEWRQENHSSRAWAGTCMAPCFPSEEWCNPP